MFAEASAGTISRRNYDSKDLQETFSTHFISIQFPEVTSENHDQGRNWEGSGRQSSRAPEPPKGGRPGHKCLFFKYYLVKLIFLTYFCLTLVKFGSLKITNSC